MFTQVHTPETQSAIHDLITDAMVNKDFKKNEIINRLNGSAAALKEAGEMFEKLKDNVH